MRCGQRRSDFPLRRWRTCRHGSQSCLPRPSASRSSGQGRPRRTPTSSWARSSTSRDEHDPQRVDTGAVDQCPMSSTSARRNGGETLHSSRCSAWSTCEPEPRPTKRLPGSGQGCTAAGQRGEPTNAGRLELAAAAPNECPDRVSSGRSRPRGPPAPGQAGGGVRSVSNAKSGCP